MTPCWAIIASGLASCADESCFVEVVRGGISSVSLPPVDVVYLEMILAIITDEPEQFIELIKQPDMELVAPPGSLPIINQWQYKLGQQFWSHVSGYCSDIRSISFFLRTLGLALLVKNEGNFDIQKKVHKQLREIVGDKMLPILYGTSDPFVTHEWTYEQLLKNFAKEMPVIAEWFAIHSFIRYLHALATGHLEETEKQHQKIKDIITYAEEIDLTIERLARVYSFFQQQPLSFK